jgi:hypothetical protein
VRGLAACVIHLGRRRSTMSACKEKELPSLVNGLNFLWDGSPAHYGCQAGVNVLGLSVM